MLKIYPDSRGLKLILWLLVLAGLLPLALLAWAAQNHGLGSEPSEFLERRTGLWAINFLLLTLCVTPLRALTQAHWLLRLRRPLGLLTFLYATLHLLAFLGPAHDFSPEAIARGAFRQPFVFAGFAAFLLMIPLAATSSSLALKVVGGTQWRDLHRNIYLIGILACAHFLWLSKPEALYLPVGYSLALAALLYWRIRERKRQAMLAPTLPKAQPLRFYRKRPD